MVGRYSVCWSALPALLLVAGCGGPPAVQPGQAATGEPAMRSVGIVSPERRTLRHMIAQPGATVALDHPALFAKIPGYLLEWKADTGDRVRAGDLLAELWVPELVVDLGQKEALVRQAEAQLKMAKEAVPAAEAQYQRLKTRYERIARVGAILDKENIDEIKYGSDAEKARLEMARADVGVKEAQLEVAQKNRDYARTMLQYAQIRAPFDGVVTKRHVDKGQFVQPATGTKGDILFELARTDIMRIFVHVPETDADWVTDGMNAEVRFQALGGRVLGGKVTRTSWSLDRTARTLLAAVDLPNPDGKIRPGMYAYAIITGEWPDVLTLPVSAVITQGDVTQGYQMFCYLVQDGKARRTLIEVGARDAQWVEVLKKQTAVSGGQPKWEDFAGNEAIVERDVAALSDGQAVEVRAK